MDLISRNFNNIEGKVAALNLSVSWFRNSLKLFPRRCNRSGQHSGLLRQQCFNYATDWIGIGNRSPTTHGEKAVILGAGCCHRSGVALRSLDIGGDDPEPDRLRKQHQLAERFDCLYGPHPLRIPRPAQSAVVVNATSIGMEPELKGTSSRNIGYDLL